MTAGRLLSDVVSVIYDETRDASRRYYIRDRLITRNRIIRTARFACGFVGDLKSIFGFSKMSISSEKKIQISSPGN